MEDFNLMVPFMCYLSPASFFFWLILGPSLEIFLMWCLAGFTIAGWLCSSMALEQHTTGCQRLKSLEVFALHLIPKIQGQWHLYQLFPIDPLDNDSSIAMKNYKYWHLYRTLYCTNVNNEILSSETGPRHLFCFCLN